MIKLLSSKINSITIAAFLVAFSSMLSRFLGIFRDRILAGEFGADQTLDVYYAAFRIPDLIFNLIVLGALSAGFIPIFTRLIKNKKHFSKNKNNPWFFTSNVLNILLLALIVLSGLGIVFAPFLMKFVAPGFNYEEQVLSANLSRIMFLSPIFLGISGILGGVLQSYKRFFVYSLSPILYNIGIIVGALYFVPLWGVYGLAWGVAFGSFLHMAVQLPIIFRLGFKYYFVFDFFDKNLIKVFKMMLPRVLSLGISQVNLLVITVVASTLPAGSLAIFNFANNLQSFPIGIFGISFAVAAFPVFSAVAHKKEKLLEHFSSVFRQILFFVVPSTVLLLTLRAQIIRVVLGSGKFNWEDTIATMNVLAFFSISLFAQALIPLLVRVFYAREDAKTPFFMGFLSAVLNIFLSLYFSKKMGVSGLALSFSLSSIFNFILLWFALRVKVGVLDDVRILISVIKFSASAFALGLSVQSMKLLVWLFVDMRRFWGIFLQGFIPAIFGIFVYLVFCALLRSEEFFDFWQSLKKRLPKSKLQTGDQGEARGI